jgi:predicted TIM-barrel fold metal-dependent hydrolase
MRSAGVDCAVLVPPSWQGECNDVVLEAAQAQPNRFAAIGRFSLTAPGARDEIAGWLRQRGMYGLRIAAPYQVSGDGTHDWLWAEAEAARVPVMVSASAAQPDVLHRAAERHPDLRITIDHFQLPTRKKDDEAFVNFDQTIALGKHPNIAIKASCLPSFTSDGYPFRRLHPYIRRAYDAYGPQRMFWGSDYSALQCTYRECLTLFTEELHWLTSADLEWIMGRALCEWIGWKAGKT